MITSCDEHNGVMALPGGCHAATCRLGERHYFGGVLISSCDKKNCSIMINFYEYFGTENEKSRP